jgi:Flp pilus assembly protein TadD
VETRRHGLRGLAAVLVLAGLAAAAGCGGRPSRGRADDSYQGDLERGEVALSLGQLEDAHDAYSAALALRPGEPRALAGLARTLLAEGDAEAALVVMDQLEHRDPRRLERELGEKRRRALFLAAQGRLARGDSAGALRALDRLAALDPSHPGLRALRTDALVAESGHLQVAGRGQEAAALLREAVGADTAQADLAFALATSLVERGRLDTAISVLSDALLRHPDEARLQALMDRALRIRYPRGFAD